jgi:hypothetical protein
MNGNLHSIKQFYAMAATLQMIDGSTPLLSKGCKNYLFHISCILLGTTRSAVHSYISKPRQTRYYHIYTFISSLLPSLLLTHIYPHQQYHYAQHLIDVRQQLYHFSTARSKQNHIVGKHTLLHVV